MAVVVAERQKGRDKRQHERVGEMRRWETPKMEVWGFPQEEASRKLSLLGLFGSLVKWI